jgi:hypothetical protein
MRAKTLPSPYERGAGVRAEGLLKKNYLKDLDITRGFALHPGPLARHPQLSDSQTTYNALSASSWAI